MKYLILIFLIFLISCNNKNNNSKKKYNNFENEDSSLIQSTLKIDVEGYDSVYVLNTIGKESFYSIRKSYRVNLYNALKKFKSLRLIKSKSLLELKFLFNKLNEINSSVEEIKETIPISPSEFKIYDSCFSDSEYSKDIFNLEKTIYTIASKSDFKYEYKIDLCVLYTNMYSYIYKGILLNEERIGDGYYYYDINKLICNNSDLYCNVIWYKVNKLCKSEKSDLLSLFNCRCKKNNIDEFEFCD